MKKPRYTPGQVAFDLRQPEESAAAAAVCPNMGVSEQTFNLLNKRFRGIGGGRMEKAAALGEEPEAEAIGNRT